MKLPSFNPHLGENREPVGLSRYLDTLLANMGVLLACNVLFVLFSLPVVTAGPALVALNRVCCNVLRGKKSSTADFMEAFKKNFRQGLVLSFTLLPLLVWLPYMAAAELQLWFETGSGAGALCFYTALYLAVLAVAVYLLPLTAHMTAPLPELLRNAALLCVSGKGYTVAATITTGFIFVAILLWLPNTLPLMLLVHFSFLAYNACFFSWKIMSRDIFDRYYERHPEQAERDSYY